MAMPKSPIWKVPARLQKMLSGLMSITITPWLCRNASPCNYQHISCFIPCLTPLQNTQPTVREHNSQQVVSCYCSAPSEDI